MPTRFLYFLLFLSFSISLEKSAAQCFPIYFQTFFSPLLLVNGLLVVPDGGFVCKLYSI